MLLFQVTELVDVTKPALEKALTSHPDDPSGSLLITVLFAVAIGLSVVVFFLLKHILAKKSEPTATAKEDDTDHGITEIRIQLGRMEALLQHLFNVLK
jgi:hypothetical protein